MTEKGRINKRRLALLLLTLAIVIAVATLLLQSVTGRHNEEPPRSYSKISFADKGKCKKIVDLEPGRKFHSFNATFVTGNGQDTYIATEPLGSEEIPRELVIEEINPSFDRIECYLVIREHSAAASSIQPVRSK